MVIGCAIGALIGAVILRAGISLYNRMAQPGNSVPEPLFGRAALIMFVTTLVNAGVGLVLGMILGGVTSAANADQQSTKIIINLISFPVSMGVMAAMLSQMLPTTFGRALLVTLCTVLIGLAI